MLERVVGEYQAIRAGGGNKLPIGGWHRQAAFVVESNGCFALKHVSARNVSHEKPRIPTARTLVFATRGVKGNCLQIKGKAATLLRIRVTC